MGRYLTSEALRLGLSGLAVGFLTGFAWRAAGRRQLGAAPFVLALFVAAKFNGRSDWPQWAGVPVAALVILLAGAGSARLLANPAVAWRSIAAGALISIAGVWAGVPETGPALLAAGSVGGLAVSAAVVRLAWAPRAGFGVAAILGWAALSGAAGRPWAAIGGALCSGAAPWLALPPPPRPRPATRIRGSGTALLVSHCVLVVLAARWIGVVPDAGWIRVAVVALIGLAVAWAARRGAMM